MFNHIYAQGGRFFFQNRNVRVSLNKQFENAAFVLTMVIELFKSISFNYWNKFVSTSLLDCGFKFYPCAYGELSSMFFFFIYIIFTPHRNSSKVPPHLFRKPIFLFLFTEFLFWVTIYLFITALILTWTCWLIHFLIKRLPLFVICLFNCIKLVHSHTFFNIPLITTIYLDWWICLSSVLLCSSLRKEGCKRWAGFTCFSQKISHLMFTKFTKPMLMTINHDYNNLIFDDPIKTAEDNGCCYSWFSVFPRTTTKEL